MENQVSNQDSVYAEQIIKQVINSWVGQNKAVTDFFSKYDDSAYLTEVAPGRNRAIYIFGHLIAINNALLPLFGLGDKLFPQFDEIFVKAPDKSVAEIPSLAELKQKWETLNIVLADHFNKLSVADWLGRHNSVSEEDFKINPLRNKLTVFLSRINHQSYHLGQLILLAV